MYILPNFLADRITKITQELMNPIFINTKHKIFQLFRSDYLQQKSSPFLPHAAFAFTMFVLLGFLQVKYQGKNESPFESSPSITSLAVVSLLLYCFCYAVEQASKPPFSRRVVAVGRWCMSAAGLLAVSTTASLLFPEFVQPAVFGFFFVVVAAERIRWVYVRVRREPTQSEKMAKLFRPLGQFFTDRRQLLPL